jgi:hypothetical protein
MMIWDGEDEGDAAHQRIRDVMIRLDNEKMHVGKA